MKRRYLTRSTAALALAAGTLILFSMSPSFAAGKKMEKAKGPHFTKQGELVMPKQYRHWVFVGAPVTPNELNNGKAAFPEFHHVYIDPRSYAAYRKTGTFPDGTMLVKELVSVGSKSAASGSGYFAGDFIGVAMAVKDSTRFAKEPGYWGYFSFMGEKGQALPSAKALPTAACNSCHEKNAAEDWVFTQFYPVLRETKKK